MQLLDVPPEVFQQVIEIFVSTFGIRKAMKARQVSKTFSSYINEEVFARQPVNKLKVRIPKRLLQKNLALFLERRTVARYGAPDLLPSMITKIVDYLLNVVGSQTRDSRVAWTKKVIATVVEHSPDALHTALTSTWKKTRDYASDTGGCLALVVAIYLGDQTLVNRLLTHGASPWTTSSLFGTDAMYLATRLKATPLVGALLSTTSPSRGSTFAKCQSGIVRECTYLALRNGSPDLATELFSWHIQHLGKPYGKHCSNLVKLAVASNALAFVQIMQTSGCLDLKKAPHTCDIIEGLLQNPKPQEMLYYFESNHFLRLHKRYRRGKRDQAQSLIDHAVGWDRFPLADAILAVNDDLETAGRSQDALSNEDRRRLELFLEETAVFRNDEVAQEREV